MPLAVHCCVLTLTSTATGPAVVDVGEVQSSWVGEMYKADTTREGENEQYSVAADGKLVPRTCTSVPPAVGPEDGDTDVTEGGESTVTAKADAYTS